MRRHLLLPALLAATTLLFAGAASAQSMSRQLKEPAAVPLDFLTWIDRDTDWLQKRLAELGAAGAVTIGGGALETTDVDTLKAANRIRGFAYLAGKSLRPPFFDLALTGPDGTFRCVTEFPQSIAPDIGPMDFAKKSFPVAAADQTILKSCVISAKGSNFTDLDRQTFRDRYFDQYGRLKAEFRELGYDPSFLAKAIDEGYFLSQEDYSGRPKIE